MVANVDEPSRVRELPPFERRCHALIRDTRKNDEGEETCDDEDDVACA
jgi:hypothetical protein